MTSTDPTLPDTTRTPCVLARPDRPHDTNVGLVCDHHLQRLSADLRQAEQLTIELAARPVGTAYRSPAGGGTRGSALASQRSVLDLERDTLLGRTAVAFNGEDPEGWDATQQPAEFFATWVQQLHDDPGRRPVLGGGTLIEDRRILVQHLEWIATREWVAAMAKELAELLVPLRRAAAPARPDIGPCPLVIDGEPCPGRIRRSRGARPWARLPNGKVTQVHLADVAAGPMQCTVCRTTWSTPAEEARLRIMLQSAARDAMRPRTDTGALMVTARELHTTTGLSIGAVRVRLHRAGVEPVPGHGEWWYPPDALIVGPVVPTNEQRAAAAEMDTAAGQ